MDKEDPKKLEILTRALAHNTFPAWAILTVRSASGLGKVAVALVQLTGYLKNSENKPRKMTAGAARKLSDETKIPDSMWERGPPGRGGKDEEEGDHLPASFFDNSGDLKEKFYGLHLGKVIRIAPQRVPFLRGAQSWFSLQDGEQDCVPAGAPE